MTMHHIVLFAHVLSAFLYLLAHGAAVAVAYRVRRETNAERLRALLELSRSTVPAANYLFASTVLCGVALGFLGHWWSARWSWASIAILILVIATMGRMAGPYFRRIRSAIGLTPANGTVLAALPEVRGDELARAIASGNAQTITALAMGGWAVILWLMLFKPF